MLGFLRSSVGKKYIMGITGLIWSGFVLSHMLGNLLIFISPEAYNSYGHMLTSGKIIYVMEVFLVGALFAHIASAISLTLDNKKSKGSSYEASAQGIKKGSLASQTMAIQGSLIFAFIVFHIISFKFGTVYLVEYNGVEMRDLFKLVQESFQSPLYTFGYIIILALLGLHLSHGVGSTFQSLGIMNRKNRNFLKAMSFLYAGLVSLGFMAQPLYIYLFSR